MSQTSSTPTQRLVTELKVSAHMMVLDPGVFCVFSAPGGPVTDPTTGLPGVRVSRPPSASSDSVSISTFNSDGWLGGESSAALVRVADAPAQVLVTIYQAANTTQEAPKLQVLKLSEGVTRQAPAAVPAPVLAAPAAEPVPPPAQSAEPPPPAGQPEVAAHVQRRGDLLTRLGDWMGERGSQSWIEGFAISPSRLVEPADIEYQAVLGKGWLSPWSEGGAYCGSRGMALPILGLRVRLKGDAAARYDVRVSATFTDGSSVGPVDGSATAEAPSLAPLEAFLVEIVPLDDAEIDAEADIEEAPEPPAASRRISKPAAPAAKAPAAKPVLAPARATPARTGWRAGPAGKAGTKGRR